MRNLVFKSPYTIQHQLLGETGGGALWPCLLPDSEAKVLYVRASFAGKSAFRPEKRRKKIKSDGLA